jgi:hypothetical protein
MRYFPNDPSEMQELAKLNPAPWMIECLKCNPDYCSWGPYEDYMGKTGEGWDARIIKQTWKDFGPWNLDALNEVVNFYFEIERSSDSCSLCSGVGLNQETKKIHDDWYSFDKEEWIYVQDGKRRYNDLAWCNHITQDEVDALWESGRLKFEFKEKPNAEQVNEWNRTNGMGHDAINKFICVKARAQRLGVYGHCESCKGDGYIFTEHEAKLGLVLWMLHPRKGCSRGIHIKSIQQDELPQISEYLNKAAKRNAERFSKLEQLI